METDAWNVGAGPRGPRSRQYGNLRSCVWLGAGRMSKWHAFQYRDFWDKPRLLYVSNGERCFLLSSPFDEALDQYPENYTVHLMPHLGPEALSGSWERLDKYAIRLLGTIALPLSALDDTRRKQIDLGILDSLLVEMERQ